MEPPVQIDNRMDFLGLFVQKTLKLKPEKWSRMMATEEHKAVVMKFLERPFPLLLVIILTPTAQLVASNTFPLALKSKGIYFIKRGLEPVCKIKPSETIIMGDLSCKIIDQLASLVDEVLVPLLSNSQNHGRWPAVIAKDVQKHVHSLKSTVYQVKGQVNGQTVLPMPVGVEKVQEAERALVESEGEICDLYLKSAIEGVIIKWATQINGVLLTDSSEATGGPNPIPSVELQFWTLRLRNLQYIYEQLKDPRVRSMAIILEKTNSAYYSCFRNLFKSTVMALAEAKDICIHLKPLKKYIRQLQETEFSDCVAVFAPLMHVVCLVWYNSKYYDQVKIIVLFKQICNLLIQEAKKFLDPTTLFHSDIDEAMQRVQVSIKILKHFFNIFTTYKDNLGTLIKDREPELWNFHPNTIFQRFFGFIERLNTIQWFFNTILEFSKLEKVEIGGFKGRILSAKVVGVFGEFQQCFSVFSGKSYDVLDPDDNSFMGDFENFKQKIFEMDLKLAAILCQAFEDCSNLESIFKLINIVGSVLDRPLIKQEFTSKYSKILTMLSDEITTAETLFEYQLSHKEKEGGFLVDKYMPPVAGALRWTSQLYSRMVAPMQCFKALQHPITKSPEAVELVSKFEVLTETLHTFEANLFKDWTESISEQIEVNLNQCLLKRNLKTKELYLNFNPQLSAILREVHYLKHMSYTGIPEAALVISESNEMFRKYTANLNCTIEWYNKIRRTSKDVEYRLIENEIEEIDKLVMQGQHELNWNSEALSNFMQKLHTLVGNLQQHLQKSQENLVEIRNALIPFARQPLFERKDCRKDSVLCIEEREERIAKRYGEIKRATDRITVLLNQNMELFEMTDKQDSPKWTNYIDYIDNIIMSYLYQTVGCSLGYINEHMDSANNLAPLFEAQLILLEPNMVFIPSLETDAPDGFKSLIQSLLVDIVKIASIVVRFSKTKELSYEEEIESNTDIIDIKNDILLNVDKAIHEAYDFCENYHNYAYLWLDDRNFYLKQFLKYSRQLSLDEQELVNLKDPMAPEGCPPKMEAFREQIDIFENLYLEVEKLKTEQIFSAWFKVDVKPFKQALLNTIRKWGNMFKDYLVDTVTTNLCNLGQFIRSADEGLQQAVTEGDYTALVNVMGYLLNVKERQATTDEMFGPLRDTIELLKFYDQDIPEEVNVWLQELPEQWSNTKKIALTVKQQVAPLQAAEVSCIRKKISDFDNRILYYREFFKRYQFFKYECENPYFLIDRVDKDIDRFEAEMAAIQESGSLFEVTVPDFKVLKQCRRELRMLKQLWDYVYIVHTCVDDWKTTPWRQIDVENMDIECKKFAKEIRMLDKEMRGWETYLGLEATIKNTLTSLKAVGELQNPAIRERHWNQLMKSTKVNSFRPIVPIRG